MKTRKAVLSLLLVVALAGAPASVLADPGRHGGPPSRGGRHPVMGPGPGHFPHQQFPPPQQFIPHQPFHQPFRHHGFPRFPYYSPYFYGSGYFAPPVYYGSSLGYDYGSSSFGYDPPMTYAPPPPQFTTTFMAAPPRPSVIEFSSGRYELRGDGISSPYVWVWVPNPPPPPQSPTAWPTATRAEPPSPPAGEAPAPRRTQLYRWVDEQGVIHLTDNPESVPAQYRKPAARAQGGAS